MKINSTDTYECAPALDSKYERATHTQQVLNNSGNITKRMMDQSMVAYTRKMQDISSLRRQGYATTQGKTGSTTNIETIQTGRTASWLEATSNYTTTAFITKANNNNNHHQHTGSVGANTTPRSSNSSVGRKWATLNKLRKPQESVLKSISDTPLWSQQQQQQQNQSVNNNSSVDSHLQGVRVSAFPKRDRPRSRSVLDIREVDNKPDINNQLLSPLTRPSSELGGINENTDPNVNNTYFHPHAAYGGFRGRRYFDASLWDNPKLRSETNVLTLPDITDTASEISSIMDMSSSVQIVPFPAVINELQAVPAKLHSNHLMHTGTKKSLVDNKGRQNVLSRPLSKDTKIVTNNDKSSARITQNTANNNGHVVKNSTTTTTPSPRTPRASGKDKPKSTQSTSTATKSLKESPRKETAKETGSKSKSKAKSPSSDTNNGNNKSRNTKKDQSKLGIIKEDPLSSGVKNDNDSTINGNVNPAFRSSPNRDSPDANILTMSTNDVRIDEECQSTTSSTIKSVLKPGPRVSDKGKDIKPKGPKKSVQFGPKMIKEVTKIVYPWNETHSSEEEEDEEDTGNEETSEEEDDGDSSDG